MADSAHKKLNLSGFLPYRLSVLSNRISRAIANDYEQRFNLSIAEWRVMAILGSEPGLSAKDVAAKSAMDKVAVSRAVAKLMKAKRLRRRADQADRRRILMELTQEGFDIYQEVVPLAKKWELAVLERLSKEDQARLDDILSKLIEAEDAVID